MVISSVFKCIDSEKFVFSKHLYTLSSSCFLLIVSEGSNSKKLGQ